MSFTDRGISICHIRSDFLNKRTNTLNYQEWIDFDECQRLGIVITMKKNM